MAALLSSPFWLHKKNTRKQWQFYCRRLFGCTKRKQESNGSFVVVAFFATTKPKQKAMATKLPSPFSLQQKKKQKGNGNFVAVAFFAVVQPKQKKAMTVCLLHCNKRKKQEGDDSRRLRHYNHTKT
jgi:hypothetical protein